MGPSDVRGARECMSVADTPQWAGERHFGVKHVSGFGRRQVFVFDLWVEK